MKEPATTQVFWVYAERRQDAKAEILDGTNRSLPYDRGAKNYEMLVPAFPDDARTRLYLFRVGARPYSPGFART